MGINSHILMKTCFSWASQADAALILQLRSATHSSIAAEKAVAGAFWVGSAPLNVRRVCPFSKIRQHRATISDITSQTNTHGYWISLNKWESIPIYLRKVHCRESGHTQYF